MRNSTGSSGLRRASTSWPWQIGHEHVDSFSIPRRGAWFADAMAFDQVVSVGRRKNVG